MGCEGMRNCAKDFINLGRKFANTPKGIFDPLGVCNTFGVYCEYDNGGLDNGDVRKEAFVAIVSKTNKEKITYADLLKNCKCNGKNPFVMCIVNDWELTPNELMDAFEHENDERLEGKVISLVVVDEDAFNKCINGSIKFAKSEN